MPAETVYFKKETYHKLYEIAKKMGISVSRLVVEIVEKWLEEAKTD